MSDVWRPADPQELEGMIAEAVAHRTPLIAEGGGSKRAYGGAVTGTALDVSALRGVALYEPEELVLSVGAATPLAEIEALLASRGQGLAFEPPDWGPLLGAPAGRSTLGGALACNLSGPRRVLMGAARDHFLGFGAVSGRAVSFKAGGRVVKNVTGFDLCKLMAGSMGTLAVLSSVTVKVLPLGETVRTLLVTAASLARARPVLIGAMHMPLEVSGAALLDGAAARRSKVGTVAGAADAVAAVRLEGPLPAVTAKLEILRQSLKTFGETDVLDQADSRMLWREIGDVAFFVGAPERVAWRIVVPPAQGTALAERLGAELGAWVVVDWAGGLIWAALPPSDDAGAAILRALVAEAAGQAVLVRAADAVRARVGVFPPAPSAALTARIKQAFDPLGILNPGRMG